MVGRISIPLTFLLCLLAPVAAWAEQPPIRSYTTADGLPSDEVFRVVADSRGFLWFATTDGLVRFDGYAFTTYTTRDGLPDRRLSDVRPTRDGSVWVGTASGLCRFDPRGPAGGSLFTVEPLGDDPKTNQVYALLEARDGALWVGAAGGLFRLEARDGRWSPSRVEIGTSAPVTSLAEDRWGGVWAGVSPEVRLVRPDGRVEVHPLPGFPASQTIDSTYEDSSGRLWVGTRLGIWRSAPRNAPDDPLAMAKVDALPDTAWSNAFLEARDGRLLLATGEGLWREAEPGGALERRATLDAACDRSVLDMIEDRDGNLWLATGCGVLRVDRHGFTRYSTDDGLAVAAVNSIFETRAGDLVVTTRLTERLVHRLAGPRFAATAPNVPGGWQGWGWGQTVTQDREGAWWAPTGKGLYRFPASDLPERTLRARPEPIYEGSEVFRVFEDSRGDVWFSTTNSPGLLRWERASGRVVDLTAETGVGATNDYTGFAETRDGAVWIGTGASGLLRHAGGLFERFTAEDGAPAGWIRALHVDDAGRLWIASSRGGLARVADPAAERPVFVAFTTADGLASDNVWSVVSDRWGRIYAGSPRGVDRVDPATGRVKHYSTADGLPRGQIQVAYRDRDGALWFGSGFGVARLDPEPEREREPPRTLLTGLRVAGVARPVSALGEAVLAPLALGPDEDSVSLDFLGLGVSLGEELRYQYKLEGAGDEWSAPSVERTVTFASLAPGSYRFLVRAVDSEGLASAEPAVVAFTVAAPVWQRWWFLALAAAAIAAAGYGAHRYRVRRLLEIERVRTHIATDLHDDIGANLTRIAFLSEVAGLGGESAGSNGALSSIARISRESVASMNDIVWAIDPNRDTFVDLSQRMRQYAEEVFLARGVELDFSAPEDVPLKLGHDLRRQLYLAFKEAVNNAARHSDCSRARVALHAEGGRLVLEVSDDGRGFDVATARRGNGLANLRKRAAALGAGLEVGSEPGRGTRVVLAVPLRPPT
jgi:ligand-binding sensor domain-containing protein/two-component sensor histidine kinase